MYKSWDRKCHFQGHVTLTYKVTRQGHDIRLYYIDFPEMNNLRNKKNFIALARIQAEIESVTFKVTWPWRTRSPVAATILDYIPLTFLSGKTLETKKNYCSSVYTSEDKNAVKSVMTSWRQVTTSWRRVMTIQPSLTSWTRKWIFYISWKFQLDILIGTRTTAFLTLGVSKDPTTLVKELFSPH